jgi:hypothetical protein
VKAEMREGTPNELRCSRNNSGVATGLGVDIIPG